MLKKSTRSRNGKGKARRRGKISKVTGEERSTSGLTDGLRAFCLSQTVEPFPWNDLPQELRVKVLQNLRRFDLDNCRLLNRDTLELIRSNEKWMKRRIIDKVSIIFGCIVEIQSYDLANVRCFEEERISPLDKNRLSKKVRRFDTIPFCLPDILKNADVRQLEITEHPTTDDLLRLMSLILRYAGCKVHTLAITRTFVDDLSSAVLLRFLHDVSPEEIILSRIIKCSRESLNVEILQFILSRQYFCLEFFFGYEGSPSPTPIDDEILAHVTAVDFKIGSPNMITLEGLKTFFKGLSEKQQEVHGIISTSFALNGVSFSEFPYFDFRIKANIGLIEFWFKPRKLEMPVLMG